MCITVLLRLAKYFFVLFASWIDYWQIALKDTITMSTSNVNIFGSNTPIIIYCIIYTHTQDTN